MKRVYGHMLEVELNFRGRTEVSSKFILRPNYIQPGTAKTRGNRIQRSSFYSDFFEAC